MNVKISELKARLSAYLDIVRSGETVTILDRKTPIAQLAPITDRMGGLRVTAPSSPVKAIGTVRGVRLKRSLDIVKVLADTRGTR